MHLNHQNEKSFMRREKTNIQNGISNQTAVWDDHSTIHWDLSKAG